MSDRCAGCTNKYKFFEKPTLCPHCQRSFCNSCLAPPKKAGKKAPSGALIGQETCVYCSRKFQHELESEDTEVLETFQERFYKHARTEPPIQTRVQLDFSKTAKPQEATVKLSEEDKAFFERLKKLKEGRKAGEKASFDEDSVRDRLAKLRGETEGKSEDRPGGGEEGRGVGGASDQPGKGTQTEQAQDLIEQMKDEVRMDSKLEDFNQDRDEELYQRFQALKGKSADSAPSGQFRQSKPPDMSEMQQMLENMEVQVGDGDEDPETLLQDLKAFQSKEEKLALSEAQSADVLALVDKARELAKEEEQPDLEEGGEHLVRSSKIQYPPISDLDRGTSQSAKATDNSTLQADVNNLVKDTALELKEDEVREKEDVEFVAGAAERLSKLRSQETNNAAPKVDDIAEDEVVRSKLSSKDSRKSLDFNWSYYGSELSDPDKPPPSSGGYSAARQLGIQCSGNFEAGEEENTSDEVQALLKQVMAEAELDQRLERTGLSHYLDSDTKKDSAADKPDQQVSKPDSRGGASVGATAASWGGGRGYAVGSDIDLPWCCICNEDATIRCFDCDDDLYCTRCFSEGHEQFGLFDHKYAPFEPQRKPT